MNSAVNNKDDWESLINGVDKSNIPIEFINIISLQLYTPVDGSETQDINVKDLRVRGFSDIEIEVVVRDTINNFKNNIESMHFYVDIDYVASTVQHQTNLILINI